MINLNRCCEYKDMYNIYNLISKIDNGYKLLFDNELKVFVVINSAKNNQICLKTRKLSPNIINSLKKTRVENFHKIIKNIDDINENLIQKNKEKLVDELSNKMQDMVYLSKRVSSISNNNIQKIIGG